MNTTFGGTDIMNGGFQERVFGLHDDQSLVSHSQQMSTKLVRYPVNAQLYISFSGWSDICDAAVHPFTWSTSISPQFWLTIALLCKYIDMPPSRCGMMQLTDLTQSWLFSFKVWQLDQFEINRCLLASSLLTQSHGASSKGKMYISFFVHCRSSLERICLMHRNEKHSISISTYSAVLCPLHHSEYLWSGCKYTRRHCSHSLQFDPHSVGYQLMLESISFAARTDPDSFCLEPNIELICPSVMQPSTMSVVVSRTERCPFNSSSYTKMEKTDSEWRTEVNIVKNWSKRQSVGSAVQFSLYRVFSNGQRQWNRIENQIVISDKETYRVWPQIACI